MMVLVDRDGLLLVEQQLLSEDCPLNLNCLCSMKTDAVLQIISKIAMA